MPLPQFHMIDDAPQPVATFSHATEVDGWVFLTGQMPTWPGEPERALPKGVEAQTRRVMDNLTLVLEGLGLGMESAVQVRVYLADRADVVPVSKLLGALFSDPRPTNTTIICAFPLEEIRAEIEVVARKRG